MKNLFKLTVKQFVNILNSWFSIKADLTCTSELDLPAMAKCGETKFSHPVMIVLGKPGTTIPILVTSPVHTQPTALDLAAALVTVGANRLIAINPISEGSATPTDVYEKNEQGLDEKIHEMMVIDGKMKYLNDATIDGLRQLEIFKRYQGWYIDAMGRLYGGVNGFAVTCTWGTLPTKAFGFENKAFIPIKMSFNVDPTVTFATSKDADFLDLDNA